jgi:4-alpha-glucanotransferase
LIQSRASGILLHITSLPGRFGIGDLGNEAYRFADFLYSAGQRLWQFLPLGSTRDGNSPYQCLSVFAGNPLLISLEKLVEDKFLEPSDVEVIPSFPENSVDYSAVAKYKIPLLKRSFEIFSRRASLAERDAFEAFCEQECFWLRDYSLFMALKEVHGSLAWNSWEEDIMWRQPQALEHWGKKLDREICYHQYQQFEFAKQWSELKKYCHDRGIRLIGDIPIFVALDNAELWSHPEMFYLDNIGKPTVVAGVPPDYFSQTGQLWGNPLYRWEAMEKDGYLWWTERFRAMRRLVDIIRIDHFRGFEKYWEVPATESNAINGRWVPGPGAALFEAVQKKLGQLPIIAEDLGHITPEVEELRDLLGFWGMKVLQFEFGNDCDVVMHNISNYPSNCVVYTGTHDNNTAVGWFSNDSSEATTLSREERLQERQRALKCIGTEGHEVNWGFIRLALMSAANAAIIPLQDVLGLGSEARMNTPGTIDNNWRWRFTFDMIRDEVRHRLHELTRLSGR